MTPKMVAKEGVEPSILAALVSFSLVPAPRSGTYGVTIRTYHFTLRYLGFYLFPRVKTHRSNSVEFDKSWKMVKL
tara:strand:- start:174 stop:398 length:225 start_codon:yes stop_codon:yes gene_type:complete